MYYAALLVVYLIASVFFGWSDPAGANKALQDSMITPSEVGGVSWFACGTGDWYATKFIGKNAQGRPVTGAVCEGLFLKGSTVRFY